MLNPKKTKYKKSHKGRLKGKIILKNNLNNNSFYFQALEPCWLTNNQIEASRKIILKKTKKIGFFYLKIFPDKPITKKNKESRMGSGKGLVDHWVAVVKPGMIIFELINIPKLICLDVLNLINYKLPIKLKLL